MSSPPALTDTPPALAAIGDQLRQARLRRGQSRAELAGRLHMGQEQLQALEEADLALLPEPVFVIAQIRRVASALGVDIDDSIQELRQSGALQPGATGSRQPTPPPPQDGEPAEPLRQRPSWSAWPRPLGSVAGVALIGSLAWSGWQHGLGGWQHREKPASQPQGRPATASQPAEPGQLTLTSTAPSWLAVRDSQGTILFEGTFIGSKRFPLGQGLAVLAGRPDLVVARVGGGAPQPLGPIEAVRWRRFSPPPQP